MLTCASATRNDHCEFKIYCFIMQNNPITAPYLYKFKTRYLKYSHLLNTYCLTRAIESSNMHYIYLCDVCSERFIVSSKFLVDTMYTLKCSSKTTLINSNVLLSSCLTMVNYGSIFSIHMYYKKNRTLITK